MTEEPQWVAHIDAANRLYFQLEEKEQTIQNCPYYQSDACDCGTKCMYGIKEEK